MTHDRAEILSFFIVLAVVLGVIGMIAEDVFWLVVVVVSVSAGCILALIGFSLAMSWVKYLLLKIWGKW